jgi:hypothetical protein
MVRSHASRSVAAHLRTSKAGRCFPGGEAVISGEVVEFDPHRILAYT